MNNSNQEADKPLLIPANCSPVEYIIEGFRATEITYTAAVCFLSFIIGGIIFIKQQNVLAALFIIIFLTGGAVIFFRKDKYTENMIDKFRVLIKNKQMPKNYVYKYVNIYECLKNPLVKEIEIKKLKAENDEEK